MIKVGHTHEDGKVCFVVTDPRLKNAGIYSFLGNRIIVAYNSYSWHWYAYDDNGRQIATFTREFYEKCVEPLKISDLVNDPDCV